MIEAPLRPREAVRLDSRRTLFNNPEVVTPGWYVVARSKEVQAGEVRGATLGEQRVVLYRDAAGMVHAMDARCPHLGADLRHGAVVGDGIQCAFHHWCFGPDGACREAPGLDPVPKRSARVYPVQERWGFVWLFYGAKPLWELPEPPNNQKWRIIRPPSQHIRCHPHLVIANGLDASHFEALHGMTFTAPSRLIVEEPYRVTVTLQGRPNSARLQRVTGTVERDIAASFTTIGGNLAWASVESPVRFHVLFSGRPSEKGGCHTQTVLFLPRHPIGFFRAFASMYILLRDDRRILDDIRFFPGFTERDAPLQAFADLVNGI
jgi:phenylpropionate dioxygenase-like ring-hydroxylating dioxygenase large terminal subunit